MKGVNLIYNLTQTHRIFHSSQYANIIYVWVQPNLYCPVTGILTVHNCHKLMIFSMDTLRFSIPHLSISEFFSESHHLKTFYMMRRIEKLPPIKSFPDWHSTLHSISFIRTVSENIFIVVILIEIDLVNDRWYICMIAYWLLPLKYRA